MLRLTVFLFLSLTLHAAENEDLQKGLAAFQNKQFTEAETSFKKALEQKPNNPAILNDLALTAVQLEQKPLALGLWRKPLAISPNYQPAREGREFLEKQMGIRPFERDAFSLWEHRGIERMSLQMILFLNALVLAICGWLWIRYTGSRMRAVDEERELPNFPTLAVMMSTLLLGTMFLSVAKASDTLNDRATVLAAKITVHSLPANESVNLFELTGGNEVLVKREQADWLQVQNGDGASGWVKKSDVLVTSGR